MFDAMLLASDVNFGSCVFLRSDQWSSNSSKIFCNLGMVIEERTLFSLYLQLINPLCNMFNFQEF